MLRKLFFCPLLMLFIGCDSQNAAVDIDDDTWALTNCQTSSDSDHTMIFTGAALTEFQTGDVLYVFSGDEICAGKSAVFAGNNFPITVWGDDSQTEEKDGMELNEPFIFVLSSSRFSEPVEMQVTQTEEGYSALTFQGSAVVMTVVTDMDPK
jgi:hypothetical protein